MPATLNPVDHGVTTSGEALDCLDCYSDELSEFIHAVAKDIALKREGQGPSAVVEVEDIRAAGRVLVRAAGSLADDQTLPPGALRGLLQALGDAESCIEGKA